MSEKRVNTNPGDKHEPPRKRVKMRDLESLVHSAGNFVIGLNFGFKFTCTCLNNSLLYVLNSILYVLNSILCCLFFEILFQLQENLFELLV